MKIKPTKYKTDRLLTITDIPQRSPESLTEIAVRVSYDGETNGLHAEALDHYILPLFRMAPKLLEIVAKDLPDWLNRFTPEENTLLMKLADTPRYAIKTGFKGKMRTIWGPSTNLPEGMAFRGVKAGDLLVQIKTAGERKLAYSDGSKWEAIAPQCPECKAEGFAPSKTGSGCEFCDGTYGGNPPEV